MIKKITVGVVSFLALLAPAVAFAQTTGSNTFSGSYVTSFLQVVQGWVPIVIGLLFSIAFIVFIWGVITYVISGDAEKKEGAKKVMIYGIIGLAVIALAWGIVYALGSIFGISNPPSVTVPTVNVSGGSSSNSLSYPSTD